MIQEQYSRISHHTISVSGTTGIPFTVPSGEDFTNGTWTMYDLALSEIGVDENQEKAFIRIGNTVKEFCMDCASGATGTGTTSSGDYSLAINSGTTASGAYSFASGSLTVASGTSSHAEGHLTTAGGFASHAEGFLTTAIGNVSHAEGTQTTAIGTCSSSKGSATIASGDFSYAEGSNTTASGENSHAEGFQSTASGDNSYAGGRLSISNKLGEWSRSSDGQYGQYGIVSLLTQTINATPDVMGTNFVGGLFTLENNSAYKVVINVVAIAPATNDTKEWGGTFLIKNNAGTTTFVGAPALVSTYGDALLATATAVCTADNTNDAITITVTGIAATTINWFAKCEYTQVRA